MNKNTPTQHKELPAIYFPTALGGLGAGGVYQVSARAEVKGLHQSLAKATVAEALFDVDDEGNKACFYAGDEHYDALYEAQQRCADLAAKVSVQCLNGVDRDGSYESELDIAQVWGQWCAFSPDDSDSVGLSYGIAVFLSWWQQNLQRTLCDKGHWRGVCHRAYSGSGHGHTGDRTGGKSREHSGFSGLIGDG